MSLTAQICVLGVLIVGPLLYTQTLPLIPPKLEITFDPPRPPEPPPTHQKSAATSDAPTPSMRAPQRFVPLTTAGQHVFTGTSPIALPDAEPADFAAVGGVGIGGPVIGFTGGIPVGDPPPTRTATVVNPVVEPLAKPLTVSGAVLASKLITKVVPEYPAPAKAVRASGLVRLMAIIGVDGHVKELRVLSGHPLLRKAAEEAVRQWIYSPMTLSGRPVEVEASIEVNFQLN